MFRGRLLLERLFYNHKKNVKAPRICHFLAPLLHFLHLDGTSYHPKENKGLNPNPLNVWVYIVLHQTR